MSRLTGRISGLAPSTLPRVEISEATNSGRNRGRPCSPATSFGVPDQRRNPKLYFILQLFAAQSSRLRLPPLEL